MSILEGLFRYARGERGHARENFTTEALAGCIRLDPMPFVEALSQVSGLGLVRGGTIDIQAVMTQWPVPRVGAIDLVIKGNTDSGAFERWGELKVDASESGDQIRRYQQHLGALAGPDPPLLFTLGRSPLQGHEGLPHMTWQQVARAASRSTSSHWRDFVSYLEENRLAGKHEDAVTPAELISLGSFDGLVGKLGRVIELAFDRCRSEALSGLTLPSGSLRRELMGRFSTHGNLLIAIRGPSARTSQIVAGAVPTDGGVCLAIWLETWPSQSDLQRSIQAKADGSGLTVSHWSKREGQWGGIRAESPWKQADEPDQVARWFIERFDELEKAGVLGLIRESMPLTKDDPAEVEVRTNNA